MGSAIIIETKARVWKVPNYVTTAAGKMAIGQLSDVDLNRLADEWRVNLLARAAEQRQNIEAHIPKRD